MSLQFGTGKTGMVDCPEGEAAFAAGSAARFDAGVWFQSAASGLWYQVRNAGGDISAVKIDGVIYQRQPNDEGQRRVNR